jgi:hypothetical protein
MQNLIESDQTASIQKEKCLDDFVSVLSHFFQPEANNRANGHFERRRQNHFLYDTSVGRIVAQIDANGWSR